MIQSLSFDKTTRGVNFYKLYFIVALLLCCGSLSAQEDTASIRLLSIRVMNFDPDKTDSMLYYSIYIDKLSTKLNYPYGKIAAVRLKGFYYEYKEKFDSAIILYQEVGRLAEVYQVNRFHLDAAAGIGAVYMLTEQYELAKKTYFECLKIVSKYKSTPKQASQINNNLAGAYQYLKNYDSAFFYYKVALGIDESVKDSIHIEERKSNMSEVLIPMGKTALALKYLLESTGYNERHNMVDNLWYNYNNLGYLYTIMKGYKNAEHFYNLALEQAKKTPTKTKFAQTYDGLFKLSQQKGDYKKALDYKIAADSLQSALINNETNNKISELQEKYNANKREQQNMLLEANLQKEIFQKRNILFFTLGLFILMAIIAFALYSNTKKRKLLAHQNALISEQKNKLADLNHEKNSLISIVSHDLSAPITNIQLWCKLLKKQLDETDVKKKDAVDNILASADYGHNLINNILNIEKAETGTHTVQLEIVQLKKLTDEMVLSFAPVAEKKNIAIHTAFNPVESTLLTDEKLLRRVMDNLLSNAIKFSPSHTTVNVSVNQNKDFTSIAIKDQGPGIGEHERKKLFTKYGRLSIRPTGNEISTGLGLYIVKRIVEELNAEVNIVSTPGNGAEFIIQFKH